MNHRNKNRILLANCNNFLQHLSLCHISCNLHIWRDWCSKHHLITNATRFVLVSIVSMKSTQPSFENSYLKKLGVGALGPSWPKVLRPKVFHERQEVFACSQLLPFVAPISSASHSFAALCFLNVQNVLFWCTMHPDICRTYFFLIVFFTLSQLKELKYGGRALICNIMQCLQCGYSVTICLYARHGKWFL